MTIKTFIEKAVEGGWRGEPAPHETHSKHWFGTSLNKHYCIPQALLDPLAWQAVGKVEGWEKESEPYSSLPRERMHRFIDALCDGKDLETALDLATK